MHEPIEVISALLHKIDKNQTNKKMEGDINEDFTNKSKNRSNARSQSNQTRYHLNVGSQAGLTPKQLVNFIIKKTKLGYADIDDVTVSKKASFFSVPNKQHDKVMSRMSNIVLSGINTSVQIAKPNKRRRRRR
jgi:hypothetical protein